MRPTCRPSPCLNLAAPSSNGRRRGLLKRFKKPRADSIGCDPESFASQITEYLDKATTLKAERAELEDFAAQRAARGDEVPGEHAATEKPSPEASAGESSDPDGATPARGSPPTTPEVSDPLGLREVEQQREQARRDAEAATQAAKETERVAREQAARDAEAARLAVEEAEHQREEAERARVQARCDAEAAKRAAKEAERQRKEAGRLAQEQAVRDTKAAQQAVKEAERQRKEAEQARAQATRDAEAAKHAAEEAEQQRNEAERLAREQAVRDTKAAQQAVQEAEHQRKEAEQARAQATRDAEAAKHAAEEAEQQRKQAERQAREQSAHDAESAKQVIREVEQRRKEADRALVVARRDAAAAAQATKNAEQQRQEAERQAREQAQLVVEAAARAAQDAERHHREIEERTRGQATRNAEAAEQALREAERQREQAEAARVQTRRDAEAAERAAKEAERQRQAAETLRAQATRDAEAAERVAREAREQAGREVEAGGNQEPAKRVAAESQQGSQTNTWEEISLSAVLTGKAATDEPPVVDGEVVATSSSPSPHAAPSALAADPLLEALDSDLEGLVEVVDDAPATPAGVAPSPPSDSDLSSAAGQSWLLRTIGKLRTDLRDFQRPTKVRDEAPVSGPPATVAPPMVATAVARSPSRDPAPAGSESTPRATSTLPLAAWAHRADHRPAGHTDALDEAEADGLLRGLRLPEHVAHISYPAGCRIQRVRVAGGRRHHIDEYDSDAPVVILSTRVLRDVRGQSLTS